MKKFIVFIACMMMFVSASLYHNGLLGRFVGGTLTVYDKNSVSVSDAPTLDKYNGVKRLDLDGYYDKKTVLDAYDATELWCERFDELIVVYAFSPMMTECVSIKGHKVNLMIALRDDRVAIGTPILKGSY